MEISREERITASTHSPRYVVYFDGMTDVITAEQFAAHDWHIAYAGPLTSDDALEEAARSLTLEEYTGEPIIAESPGWSATMMPHPFQASADDERYCSTRLASNADMPCGQHARYHSDAPAHLRTSSARIYRRCSFGNPLSVAEPPCQNDATAIVDGNVYCDEHREPAAPSTP